MVLRSTTNRFRMLALLMLAGATLSACTPAPEPTPTPTAAFASEEEAFAAAEEVYTSYMVAFNKVDYANPETFDAPGQFTDGEYAANEREGLSQMHAEGIVRGGETRTLWFRGLDFADGIVTARVCNDVSAVTLENAAGESIVSPDRPPRSAIDLTFEVSTSASIRLVQAEGSEDSACSG